jgi:transcriptional regulator with XRE-family HTH domain
MRSMPYMARGIAFPLYERVERERALKGWSSTRLRAESGVSRSTIAKWRTQPNPPLPGTVNAVADALGIGREEALRLAGVLAADPDPLPDMSADERREVIEMIYKRRADAGRREA